MDQGHAKAIMIAKEASEQALKDYQIGIKTNPYPARSDAWYVWSGLYFRNMLPKT